MQYINLTDIYCYKEKIIQNICTFLHAKYVTSRTKYFSSVKLIYNTYIKLTHILFIYS